MVAPYLLLSILPGEKCRSIALHDLVTLEWFMGLCHDKYTVQASTEEQKKTMYTWYVAFIDKLDRNKTNLYYKSQTYAICIQFVN